MTKLRKYLFKKKGVFSFLEKTSILRLFPFGNFHWAFGVSRVGRARLSVSYKQKALCVIAMADMGKKRNLEKKIKRCSIVDSDIFLIFSLLGEVRGGKEPP